MIHVRIEVTHDEGDATTPRTLAWEWQKANGPGGNARYFADGVQIAIVWAARAAIEHMRGGVDLRSTPDLEKALGILIEAAGVRPRNVT